MSDLNVDPIIFPKTVLDAPVVVDSEGNVVNEEDDNYTYDAAPAPDNQTPLGPGVTDAMVRSLMSRTVTPQEGDTVVPLIPSEAGIEAVNERYASEETYLLARYHGGVSMADTHLKQGTQSSYKTLRFEGAQSNADRPGIYISDRSGYAPVHWTDAPLQALADHVGLLPHLRVDVLAEARHRQGILASSVALAEAMPPAVDEVDVVKEA